MKRQYRQSRSSHLLRALPVVALLACLGSAQASSLRFYGNGVNDIDRVKIRIDEPADNNPGPPADVGAADFTLEFWARTAAGNDAGAINCGANNNWILGNIVVDRDRFAQFREYGISLGAGRLAFGTSSSGGGEHTICSNVDIRDGQWHHIAVQRRRSDGRMWLWLDGALQAEEDGPDGDISYPDDGVPMSLCGPSGSASCNFSDPFLIIGVEKHDVDPVVYPSYRGWVDEIRISTVLRYLSPFTPPSQAFVADNDTAGLYHFDEGAGNFIGDSAFNSLSPGVRSFGGNPAGPEWSAETPFAPGGTPGFLQFSSSAYSVDEGVASVTVFVTRAGGSAGAVTVDYASADGTATAGADYGSVMNTLSWADGDVASKSFAIAITDDADTEGDETVNLALSNPTGGAAVGSPANAVLTINDNEVAAGQLQLTASAYSVGEGGGSTTVMVSRAGGSDGAVTVDYAVSGGTATSGIDYQATSGTLMWANGDATNKSFVIPVTDDADVEGDETANIVLSAPGGGAALGNPSSAQLTIVENDIAMPGAIALTSAAYSVSETGTSISIQVLRVNGADGAATVDFAASAGTAADGADFQAISGTLNWADGDGAAKTFDITILDDALLEGDETVIIDLSNATGAALGSVVAATLTIVDDESVTPGTLQLSMTDFIASEGAGAVIVTVTRTGGTVGAVSADYTTSDGSATAGSDYQAANGTLNWPDGGADAQTFAIMLIDDALAEAAETVAITLTAVGGGAALGMPVNATLTIGDNDIFNAGSLQLSSASYSVAEGAGSATISVSRSGGSDGAVSVDYSTAAGSATAGTDFTSASGTLSWADGDSATKTFQVSIVDDIVVESSETVQVTLSGPQGGVAVGFPAIGSLTITDDDVPPTQPPDGNGGGDGGGGASGIVWLLGLSFGLLFRARRPGASDRARGYFVPAPSCGGLPAAGGSVVQPKINSNKTKITTDQPGERNHFP